jgi:SAM-dependent methyltransferase
MSTLKYYLVKAVRKVFPLAFLEPEGDRGIRKIGHREYIGGLWDEVGTLQFEFLRAQGLQPGHFLLDIACGSLRLGVHAIPYLDRGHYLGVDKESALVAAGLENELPRHIREDKEPRIIISDSFEFHKLDQLADYAIAQSLFSHLPPRLIHQCFRNLYDALVPGGVFYATFFEVDQPRDNPDTPHDHGYFAYTRDEMLTFGAANGYESRYIGHWDHPRDQRIVEYRRPSDR